MASRLLAEALPEGGEAEGLLAPEEEGALDRWSVPTVGHAATRPLPLSGGGACGALLR